MASPRASARPHGGRALSSVAARLRATAATRSLFLGPRSRPSLAVASDRPWPLRAQARAHMEDALSLLWPRACARRRRRDRSSSGRGADRPWLWPLTVHGLSARKRAPTWRTRSLFCGRALARDGADAIALPRAEEPTVLGCGL